MLNYQRVFFMACWELDGTLIEMGWKWFGHGFERKKWLHMNKKF